MSSYPTIRNPLLPSPPSNSSKSRFRRNNDLLSNLSLSTTATLKSSMSTSSIRSFMSQTMTQISHTRLSNKKRIMPSSAMPKSKTTDMNMERMMSKLSLSKSTTLKKAENKATEPLVHYNGPVHTLESLPVEKLNWIKEEPAFALVKNPLSDYSKSIVLRKPLTRNQTYPSLMSQNISSNNEAKPKGMFYLRVLQVIATDSSKSRFFRCGIQVNQDTCLSSYVTSEKTGKNSAIAQFDETFLLYNDIDGIATVTISVYAQNKANNIFQRQNKQEICLGKENIQVSLQPKSKTTERFVLNNDPKFGQSNDFQLLVVHGTYISRRTQNMLNNTILFEDFITAYVRTGMVPRWDRFWGVLRGVQFELYDFEYKENRPPLYVIPLDNFVSAFDPSEEDDEEILINIGARGIALQFTEKAIHKHERRWMKDDLECRMYLLPESPAAAREWESKFNYVASIFDEIRGWDQVSSLAESSIDQESFESNSLNEEELEEDDNFLYDDSYSDGYGSYQQENNVKNLTVPLKLMW